MATARITTSYGNAPGYGKVTNPKPKKATSPWYGAAQGTSMGNLSSVLPPKFTPTPAPKPPTPAAAAPAPAPRKDFNDLPVDPVYDQQLAGLGRTRDDTLAGIAGQKTGTLADYGYKATWDDAGNVGSLTVDPSNPYSRAAQLQRSHDNNKRGTTNSMAARGQLYSGALINAQDTNDTNFNTASDTMQKSLGQILAGLTGQERGAKTTYETGSGVAFGERVGRAGSNPLYSPTDPTSGTPDTPAQAAGGGGTQALVDQLKKQDYTVQPGKDSKGRSGVWHTYPGGRRVFIVGAVR